VSASTLVATVLSATVAVSCLSLVSASATPGDASGATLLGKGSVFAVEGADRPAAGVLRISFSITRRTQSQPGIPALSGATPWAKAASPGFIGLQVVDPATGAVGQPLMKDGQCVCTPLDDPAVGQVVRGTVDLADPGGATVDVVPTAGLPVLGVAVSGSPARADGVRMLQARTLELLARTRRAAATVSKGRGTSIDLDTQVLFRLDSAALTSQARATLDEAATVLKAQSSRRVAINGHTDSQGSTQHNQDLSERRAEAVRRALASRLGDGWTFQVKGYGETKPMVPEVGPDIESARARNRRVELVVQ
jgi:outer membrane protein OmpA-like peptidoglycan-associated protein